MARLSFKYVLLPLMALSVCLLSKASAYELPPLFGGQLGLCENIESAEARGDSLRDALAANLQAIQSNDPEVRESIKRTIIHDAIMICGFDPVAVIEGGYLAGLEVELLAGSAIDAGAAPTLVSQTLVRLGVAPDRVAGLSEENQSTELVEVVLPPVFTIGSGLGQASPFEPTGP